MADWTPERIATVGDPVEFAVSRSVSIKRRRKRVKIGVGTRGKVAGRPGQTYGRDVHTVWVRVHHDTAGEFTKRFLKTHLRDA